MPSIDHHRIYILGTLYITMMLKLVLIQPNLLFLCDQTPRRKPPADEKLSHKDDTKIQTPPRKSTSSALSDDSDRTINKYLSPIRRSSGVLSNTNMTNLVKIAANNKKLTDPSTSWTSLPPPLAKLGKVWLVS
jgi:hypothetical protein